MKNNIYIGIDPSFSSTGLVVIKDDKVIHAGVFGFKSTKDKEYWKTYEKTEIQYINVPHISTKLVRSNGDTTRINMAYTYINEFLNCINKKEIVENNYIIGIEIPMGAHVGSGAKTDRIYTSYILGVLHFTPFNFKGGVSDSTVKIITMVPGQIKKFITGKGNAKKELILKEVFRRYDFDTSDNNIADAFAIAKYVQKENKDVKGTGEITKDFG